METRFHLPSGIPAQTTVIDPNFWGSVGSGASLMGVGHAGSPSVNAPFIPVDTAITGTARERVLVSAPLQGSGTLSGTVKAFALAKSSSGTVTTRMSAWITSEDGLTVRGVLLAMGHYGTGTALNSVVNQCRAFAVAGTALNPVGWVDGDRLVVAFGFGAATGAAYTLYGDSLGFGFADVGENESSGTGQAWVEFSQDFTTWQIVLEDIAQSPNMGTNLAMVSTGAPVAFLPDSVYLCSAFSLSQIPNNVPALASSIETAGNALVWHLVVGGFSPGPPGDNVQATVAVFYAVTPASATPSSVVTAHWPVTQGLAGLVVNRAIGANVSTPIGQTQSASSFGYPVSIALPGVSPRNAVVLMTQDEVTANSHPPGAGFGKRTDGIMGGFTPPMCTVWSPTGQTPIVMDALVGDLGNDSAGVAFEIVSARPLPPVVVTCPTIVFVEPISSYPLLQNKPVVFKAFATAWRRILTRVEYPLRPDLGWELLHDGTQFAPSCQGPGNARFSLLDPAYEFRVLPQRGWPSAPFFTVFGVDAFGLEAKDVDDGCLPGTGTTNTPTFTLVSPASTSLVFRYTPIVADLKVPSGNLKRGFVRAAYTGATSWDFIFDGEDFSPRYTNASNTVQIITDGIRISMLPDGGWKKPPKLTSYIISDLGVEA